MDIELNNYLVIPLEIADFLKEAKSNHKLEYLGYTGYDATTTMLGLTTKEFSLLPIGQLPATALPINLYDVDALDWNTVTCYSYKWCWYITVDIDDSKNPRLETNEKHVYTMVFGEYHPT